MKLKILLLLTGYCILMGIAINWMRIVATFYGVESIKRFAGWIGIPPLVLHFIVMTILMLVGAGALIALSGKRKRSA